MAKPKKLKELTSANENVSDKETTSTKKSITSRSSKINKEQTKIENKKPAKKISIEFYLWPLGKILKFIGWTFLFLVFVVSYSQIYNEKQELLMKLSLKPQQGPVEEQPICPKISENIPTSLITTNITGPTYAIFLFSVPHENHLKHLFDVLHRMGLTRVGLEDKWDLLWAHDYPFDKVPYIRTSIENHQRVNHFPGTGFLTSKVDLSTTPNMPYLAKSFRLPKDKDEFLQFHVKNPTSKFVQKHNEHRHVVIRSADQIDFTSNTTFIQEYIDDPYLINGYKFDVGVYVIITSIDPLRAYIYKGDVNFRFCPEPYHPFNASNVRQYVIADDFLPVWNVPSFKLFHQDFKSSFKDGFDAYLKMNSQDPQIVWDQIEHILQQIILLKAPNLLRSPSKVYETAENFFEMMRFDFIINKDLKVYLMEANMSPNLSAHHNKRQHIVFFEQILYTLMNLVGIGKPYHRKSFTKESDAVENMVSTGIHIATNTQACWENRCHENCNSVKCELCLNCMTTKDKKILHDTYREHTSRVEAKRIFPKPIRNLKEYNLEAETKTLNPSDKLMTKWFYEKCKMDSTFCL